MAMAIAISTILREISNLIYKKNCKKLLDRCYRNYVIISTLMQSHYLWLCDSYGGRFSQRWRRLDRSSTDMPPSNSIPPPRIPIEMVPPLAVIVSTYYRKRRKHQNLTKRL
jgi:hypothetical protein